MKKPKHAKAKPWKSPTPKRKKKEGDGEAEGTMPMKQTTMRSRMTHLMMERVVAMHALFKAQFDDPDPTRRFLTAKQLGKLHGVTDRTSERDIEFMKDRLHLPVVPMRSRGGYGYSRAVTSMTLSQFSQEEVRSLCAAMRVMETLKKTPFYPQLRSMLEKVLTLDGEILGTGAGMLADLERVISFGTSGEEIAVEPEQIDSLLGAILERHELEIEYAKLEWGDAGIHHEDAKGTKGEGEGSELEISTPAPELRRVEPLHLRRQDNVWYLFVHDPQREGPGQNPVRRFVLSRMKSVRRTGRVLAPRAFDIDAEVDSAIGIYSGKAVPVRLRFRGNPARLMMERKWHETQQGMLNADGTAEVTMNVANNMELQRWVLGWGGKVRVIEPLKLREAVEREAREMVADW